jgi:glyoxylase-like metal-dependent hydrolase (beta-lactamase superfamily II)
VSSHSQAAFPNARYAVARDEWEFWLGAADLTGVTLKAEMREYFAGFARSRLTPLQDRLMLVEDGAQIIPGIRAVAAPGHTPGHMALEVKSGGERLLMIGDAALLPFHLENPDVTAGVDANPAQTVATRRALFDRAVFDHALVQANHFPFPGLGRITRPGATWTWNPI